MNEQNGWFLICGQRSKSLEAEVNAAVGRRHTEGELSATEVNDVRDTPLRLVNDTLEIPDHLLAMIRRMCQVWEVDLSTTGITSHRKFLGPIIVGIKRATLPIVRSLLGNFLAQQREFNAQVIGFLASSSHGASERNK